MRYLTNSCQFSFSSQSELIFKIYFLLSCEGLNLSSWIFLLLPEKKKKNLIKLWKWKPLSFYDYCSLLSKMDFIPKNISPSHGAFQNHSLTFSLMQVQMPPDSWSFEACWKPRLFSIMQDLFIPSANYARLFFTLLLLHPTFSPKNSINISSPVRKGRIK